MSEPNSSNLMDGGLDDITLRAPEVISKVIELREQLEKCWIDKNKIVVLRHQVKDIMIVGTMDIKDAPKFSDMFYTPSGYKIIRYPYTKFALFKNNIYNGFNREYIVTAAPASNVRKNGASGYPFTLYFRFNEDLRHLNLRATEGKRVYEVKVLGIPMENSDGLWAYPVAYITNDPNAELPRSLLMKGSAWEVRRSVEEIHNVALPPLSVEDIEIFKNLEDSVWYGTGKVAMPRRDGNFPGKAGKPIKIEFDKDYHREFVEVQVNGRKYLLDIKQIEELDKLLDGGFKKRVE